MLHFRATPEEKTRIKENAGHAEVALSEWMRVRSLDPGESVSWGLQDRWVSKEAQAQGVRVVPAHRSATTPTQPAVEESERIQEEAEAAKQGFTASFHRDPETYEQFMERRVRELVGDEATLASQDKATDEAEREWFLLRGDSPSA